MGLGRSPARKAQRECQLSRQCCSQTVKEPEDGVRRDGREEQEKTRQRQLSQSCVHEAHGAGQRPPTLVLHPEADLSPCLQLHKPPRALLYSLSLSVLDELIPIIFTG